MLYRKRPRVLGTLIECLVQSLSVERKNSSVVTDLLGNVLVGLFACNPGFSCVLQCVVLPFQNHVFFYSFFFSDDSFVDTLFFNGETKLCLGCGAAILDMAWRVCPYCEKRIEKNSKKEGSVLAIEAAGNLMALCLGSPPALWTGDESYDHGRLVAREKTVNCVLSLLSQALTGTSKKLSSRVYNRWIDAVVQQAQSSDFFVSLMQVALKSVPAGWLSFSEVFGKTRS